MRTYIFAVDPSDKEITVKAASEKEARRAAWESLTDAERDAAASLECIEVTD